MNAMAAVGGTDSFTVVVSDEAAGLHVNGPLGLLQFVPIIGNFLNPGGGHRVAQTITVTVDPVDGVDLSFPTDFHWGVAHSGFQAEGGPDSPVDPNSDWYKWVHDPINQLLGLTNGVPENGPGAYVNYDNDAALAQEELGMNTFRMSIEWSRIFPKSTASVDISDEGGVVSQADLRGPRRAGEPRGGRALPRRASPPCVRMTWSRWSRSTTSRCRRGCTTRPRRGPWPSSGCPRPPRDGCRRSTPVEFEKYAAYRGMEVRRSGRQLGDASTSRSRRC